MFKRLCCSTLLLRFMVGLMLMTVSIGCCNLDKSVSCHRHVGTIPLKVFIDKKENDESKPLSLIKGVMTKLVAESDDLVLKIEPEDQQIVDMFLGEINKEKNNCRIKLIGKECGDVIITNNKSKRDLAKK